MQICVVFSSGKVNEITKKNCFIIKNNLQKIRYEALHLQKGSFCFYVNQSLVSAEKPAVRRHCSRPYLLTPSVLRSFVLSDLAAERAHSCT